MSENKEKLKRSIEDFQSLCCPFGYLDIQNALEICEEVDLRTEYFFDLCEEEADSLGVKFSDLDINFTILEHILQQARNKIDEVCDFDICNESDIYVYGNYMCSEYDNTTDLLEQLTEKFKELEENQIEELKNDVMTSWFLDRINFDWGDLNDEKK